MNGIHCVGVAAPNTLNAQKPNDPIKCLDSQNSPGYLTEAIGVSG